MLPPTQAAATGRPAGLAPFPQALNAGCPRAPVPPPLEDPYEETPEDVERWHVRQTYGTILLAQVVDEKLQNRDVLLVVHGAERGHVWLHDLGRSGMIYPLFRRGPYSFLAWYEQALDHMLGQIDGLYQDIPKKTKADYLRVLATAFRLSEEFVPVRKDE